MHKGTVRKPPTLRVSVWCQKGEETIYQNENFLTLEAWFRKLPPKIIARIRREVLPGGDRVYWQLARYESKYDQFTLIRTGVIR